MTALARKFDVLQFTCVFVFAGEGVDVDDDTS